MQLYRMPTRLVCARTLPIVSRCFHLSAVHTCSGQKQADGTEIARTTSITADRPIQQNSKPTKRICDFDLDNRVYIVTGGGQGLGLAMAEAVVEAGGLVYCLDRSHKPSDDFLKAQARAANLAGSLSYRRVDVTQASLLDDTVASIAQEHKRLDGLIAAAGVQYVSNAIDYPPAKIAEMMSINFGGVHHSATACARQMIKYRTPGSMVLIASMSGLIANRGLRTSVYNSSKAAVIQLSRSLAMEWASVCHGKPIRVNALCPGNILTPMCQKNFEDEPHLRKLWADGNMLGRISQPHEYRGAALFMLSDASSFMTGSRLVIDGGYTAW